MPFRTILAVVRDQENAAAIFGSAFGLCESPAAMSLAITQPTRLT
jgi:hypothetical protein